MFRNLLRFLICSLVLCCFASSTQAQSDNFIPSSSRGQSAPGEEWGRSYPVPTGGSLYDVVWDGSQFVAVGWGGTILTSPDGITWTQQQSGLTQRLSGITWGGSQFVALGWGYEDFAGYRATIITSPDGITWTKRILNFEEELNGITWSGNQFVAVGWDGTILTSHDGITWTKRCSGKWNDLWGVTWSGSQFVAVGGLAEGGSMNCIILTSPDGITWTQQNSGTTNSLRGITWSGSQFVAVGGNGIILSSPDGITWTQRNSGMTGWLSGITWSGSKFVAVGEGGTILTSSDGFTWTQRNSGAINTLRGITWSGSQFVAVGDGGTILTSPYSNTYIVTPSTRAGGFIDPGDAQTVVHGSTTTFTVTPQTGYSHGTVGGTCPVGSFSGNTYTTGAITADCEVIFSFTQQTGSISMTIEPSGARDAGAQWRRTGTTTWRNSGETEHSVPTGSHTAEFKEIGGDWTKPNNVSVTVSAGQTATATGTYTQGQGTWTSPINDTGIQFCGEAASGNNVPCTGNEPQGQDAHYGRDAAAKAGTLTKVGAGAAGFDFTKISNSGQVLPATAQLGSGPNEWACTLDNVTGIMWEVKVDDASHMRHKDHRYTWYFTNTPGGSPGSQGDTSTCSNTLGGQNCNTENYIFRANQTGLCGYTDWRMPKIKELESIVHHGRSDPAIDIMYFPNTTSSNFWSASPSPWFGAWYVLFNGGYSNTYPRSYAYNVRLARGRHSVGPSAQASHCIDEISPSNPDSTYTIHGDGTVTDTRTGLMWKRCSEGQTWTGSTCSGTGSMSTWASALAHAKSHVFANHDDWRLPNVKELRSLVEECRTNPSINETIFPAQSSGGNYWSASPAANLSNRAWIVNFSNGFSYDNDRRHYPIFRLVRDDSSDPSHDTFTVNSSGASSVLITSTPSTYGGTTNYTKTNIPNGTQITLTAPATSGGASFSSWTGCDSTNAANRTCAVTLDGDKTVTANYTAITKTIRLTGDMAFGNVTVGQSATSTLTIHNDGNSLLTISSVSFPSGFSGTWSGSIAAGGSRDVTVTFSPTVVQSYSGTITVNSDRTSGTHTMACSGTGVAATTYGSLRVTIEPAGARSAGAQWKRVGTSTWRNSGTTESGVPAGSHTIEFKTVTGWTKPNNANITVVSGQTATATGTYTQTSTPQYYPFPDTGQTKCYDNTQEITCPQPGQPFYGQDAQYQPRLPRSYTKLGHDDVILADDALHVDEGGQWIMTKDNVTGLIWELKTDENKTRAYSWAEVENHFIRNLNNANFGGFSNWRMPDIKELASLMDSDLSYPDSNIDWFPNMSYSYWSSTSYTNNTSYAWRVDFSMGYIGYNMSKSLGFPVLAVRGGPPPQPVFVENDDGTVTDETTGLMWNKCSYGQTWTNGQCTGNPMVLTWQQALEDTENLSWAGYLDWRLPNRNEMLSLIDYSRFNPAIDPTFTSISSWYWTSTTLPNDTDVAVIVNLNDGDTNNFIPKTANNYLRAVRAGHSITTPGYTLAVKSAGTSDVLITAFPSIYGGTTDYEKINVPNTQITLTAPPTSGTTTFSSWTDCDSTDQLARTCTITMNSSKTVTANYLTYHQITPSIGSGTGGTVSVSGTPPYAHGSEVTVTATPTPGYIFINWTENGTVVSKQAEYTFTVTGDRELVALFREVKNLPGVLMLLLDDEKEPEPNPEPNPGQIWTDPVTGMEFVWVPRGCYQMGCGAWTDNCWDNEKPVHEVCLDGFWMGRYEVTQGQWTQIMGSNPSYFKSGDNYPVEWVSWNDVQGFITALNSRGSSTFRLPTEAEWEYAARSGGRAEKYAGGDDLDNLGWYGHSWSSGHRQVGTKASNGLGIYDMSGNVWEWVSDWYSATYYSVSPRDNPQGPDTGSVRVVRGGSWYDHARACRVAFRGHLTPGSRGLGIGFRLALSPGQQ